MAPSTLVIDTQPLKEDIKTTGSGSSWSGKHIKKTKDTNTNTDTTIVIVSKTGTLSECIVQPANESTLEELTILLSKKCGYRNHDGFSCYHTWRYKNNKKFSSNVEGAEVIPKYIYVDIWGKTDGRAGYENKYELPPPIDELIFYGNLALVARVDKEHAIHLTTNMWNIIYEKLFGGFEDLALTALEDENEIDELDLIPSHKKTSNGYLKDGFVVEDDSDDKNSVGKKRSYQSKSSSGASSKKRAGKKNKSESTESEFITETETESMSDSPVDSDTDVNTKICCPKNTSVTKKSPSVGVGLKTKRKPTNSKKVAEEPPKEQESESELSEEEYL